MAEDFVQTMTLHQAEVDAAIKGQGERVTAVAMQVASQGAEIASVQRTMDRLESELGMGTTQVGLMYAQVTKIGASVGMLRAEIAGARKMSDDMQADTLALLGDIYGRITAFCATVAFALLVLGIALWLK